jgi:hypothetical protein
MSGLLSQTEIQLGHLTFSSNFDSGNMARVEKVRMIQICIIYGLTSMLLQAVVERGFEQVIEYQVWTAPDCAGTQYETVHTTWCVTPDSFTLARLKRDPVRRFHFKISGGRAGQTVKICMMNMNKQLHLYRNDYRPILKTKTNPVWRRSKAMPVYKVYNLALARSFPESPC